MARPITVIPAAPETPPGDAPPEGWWARYRAAVSPRLSSVGLEVLETDARYVAERAVPMRDGAPDAAAWPEGRVRTGMVVGSVQSGKTASMLGVAALSLDAGVDIVILLAGTRVGLWLQTYERLLTQLDGSTLETAWQRSAVRLLLPQPEDILNAERAAPTLYLNKPKARSALQRGAPIIFVVPKEDDHLLHLSRFLKEIVSDQLLAARQTPLTMLLLDDEADDASVLDSAASAKITPRYITALWSGDPDDRDTRHPNLLATYVAYTATPQANYLQASHNPLAPRHLHAALRTPGPVGALSPRALGYEEPRGVRGYYCGGDLFYSAAAGPPGRLVVSTEFPIPRVGETLAEFQARQTATRWSMIGEAMRAYLVSGAIRLLQSGRSLSALDAGAFDSLETLRAVSPAPHTMLFHPSARKDQHFLGAEDLVRWSLSAPGGESAAVLLEDELGDPVLALSAEGLVQRLAAEEPAWRAWLDRFGRSRDALSLLPLAPYAAVGPSLWDQVKAKLVEEVFPRVALRVLNSDPSADDRPRFDAQVLPDGRVAPPADVFTIFVAGNVLSRGLTLEGLCTSLFLRGAAEPAADTQMQMQRWLGYRGEHLPFCRVFMFSDQEELFQRYHVNDAALKWQILQGMDHPNEADRAMLVLQGAQFVATSKVDSRRVPLSPGARPSVRIVERKDPDLVRSNARLLHDLLADGEWIDLLGPAPTRRGLIRREPVDLLALADWLDRFRYSRHDPEPDNELSLRWRHLGEALRLEAPLFRPPGARPGPYAAEPQSCPYSIAAYLRLWHTLRAGHLAPGFYPTDRPGRPWSLDDNTLEPRFYLALRFGENAPSDPVLAKRGIRAMTRQVSDTDRLETLWGTRGYGDRYYGDELVDYYLHNSEPVPSIQGGSTWRPRGHPGLALFHLITDPAGGPDMLTVGLGLPHGGPDHIAALRS